MIFPPELYEAHENKVRIYIPKVTSARLHMGDIVSLAIGHPADQVQKFLKKNTVQFISIEQRGSSPKFSKDVVKELRLCYNDNIITSHLYVGYDEVNESFAGIHRDNMDVVIVQQYGSIDVSLWKSECTDTNLTEEKAELVKEYTLNPGDLIYIPRGTYHWIRTHSQRITYSFGIEDKR